MRELLTLYRLLWGLHDIDPTAPVLPTIPKNRMTEDKNATFPFTVLTFQVDRHDPNVLLPGRVAKYVPDAFESDECWIMQPTVPSEVKHLWLIDGELEETWLPVNGCKFRYFRICNSVWSIVPQVPNSKFKEQIMVAAYEWLKQEKEKTK